MNVKAISFLSFPDMGKRIFTFHSPTQSLEKEYSLLPLFQRHWQKDTHFCLSFQVVGKRIFNLHSPSNVSGTGYSLFPLLPRCSVSFPGIGKGYSLFLSFQVVGKRYSLFSLLQKDIHSFLESSPFPSREAGSHSKYNAKSLAFQGKVSPSHTWAKGYSLLTFRQGC